MTWFGFDQAAALEQVLERRTKRARTTAFRHTANGSPLIHIPTQRATQKVRSAWIVLVSRREGHCRLEAMQLPLSPRTLCDGAGLRDEFHEQSHFRNRAYRQLRLRRERFEQHFDGLTAITAKKMRLRENARRS